MNSTTAVVIGVSQKRNRGSGPEVLRRFVKLRVVRTQGSRNYHESIEKLSVDLTLNRS